MFLESQRMFREDPRKQETAAFIFSNSMAHRRLNRGAMAVVKASLLAS
jgi:hypothetical protein